MKYVVKNIVWENDNPSLPSELIIPQDELMNFADEAECLFDDVDSAICELLYYKFDEFVVDFELEENEED